MGKPLVSVIMPARDASAYIEQAIRSVMGQTVTDWELLVLDDCSEDSTRGIVSDLAREDPRIRLYANGTPLGTARTATMSGTRTSWKSSWPWPKRKGRSWYTALMPLWMNPGTRGGMILSFRRIPM